MSVTPDESAPSRVPQGPGSSSRDRFESFIEPLIVGIGVSVTGDSFAPYDFEAVAKGRRSTRR
jgi:hypothetical protein